MATRANLFASFPNNLQDISSTAHLGNLQVWPQPGAKYDNCRHLPFPAADQPGAFIESLNHFRAEPLPLPLCQAFHMGVVDEHNFFTLGENLRTSEDYLLKMNRFSGRIASFDQLSDITQIVDSKSRGPLFLYEDHIFLASATNLIWKLSKADLSLVWTFEAPHHGNFTATGMEEGKLISYQKYKLGVPMVVPISERNQKPIIVIATVNPVYGPHESSPAGLPVNNLERLVEFHHTIHYVFGIEDDGAAASFKYELTVSPTLLQEGDVIPNESFAPGESSIFIWKKLTHGTVFSDGDPVSGEPKTTGSFIFPTSKNEVTTWFSFVQSYDTGFLRFDHGNTFDAQKTCTLVNVTDGDGNRKPDVVVNGSFLQHMPIRAVLFQSDPAHILSASEAWALNYYGGSIYGYHSYDSTSGMLYVGTGNAYSVPLEDGMAARAVNVPGQDVKMDTVFMNYSDTMQQASELYLSGSHDAAYTLSRSARSSWLQLEMRRRDVRATRSARYQRFFHGSIVALKGETGQLQWAAPILGHDQRDNAFTQQPRNMLSQYVELGTNADCLGSAIVSYNERKLLLANSKYAVAAYDLHSDNFGFDAVFPDDKNGERGISRLEYAELYVTVLAKSLLAMHGGFAVANGMFYKLQGNAEQTWSKNTVLPYEPVGKDSPVIQTNTVWSWQKELTVWACDIETGEVRWIRRLASGSGGITSYGDVVIIGDTDGHLHVIDSSTGLDRAVVPMTTTASVSGPVVNNAFYFMGGLSKWTSETGSALFFELLTPLGL